MTRYTTFPQHAWNPDFFALCDAETHFVSQSWSRFVSLAPPPDDAQDEYKLVAQRIGERPGREQEILDEDNGFAWASWPIIRALQIPNLTVGNWTQELPHTWYLLQAGFYDLRPGLYLLKHRFSRGRPIHTGGAAIGATSIRTPGHPSYPAGHSAQGHMAVLLLGYLLDEKPGLMQAMLTAAERVADNRVIAGIHFPSDSLAGKSLALQLVPMLLSSESFKGLCLAAQTELTRSRRTD